MPGPVLNISQQRMRLLENVQNLSGDFQVGPFIATTDVVDLTVAAAVENGVQSATVILHKNPVAHLEAVAVNRNALVLQRAADKERNEFFRKLVWPEVVGAAGNDHREPVRLKVRTGKQIGRGFAGRIRAVGSKGMLLPKFLRSGCAAVYLIRADVNEAPDARLTRGVQKALSPQHVGPDEH